MEVSSKELRNEGYPVYGANGKIGFYTQYTHEHPTLAITCRGATCGSLHITEPTSYINGNAMALDDLRENINLKFLFYFLSVRGFNDVISGSAQPQITREGLAKVEIPLPPLPVQQRIADVLDKADALRRKDQELLEKYNELAQAIFIEMFGDPVKNEKGWSKDLLKNYYKKGVKCGPFGSALKKEEFQQEGIPVWNMDNIQAFDFVDSPNLFVSKDKYSMLKQYEVSEGDIIISRAGTVGKMCVVNSRFKHSLLSTNLIRLSLDDSRLIPLFFVHLMKYFSRRIGRLKTGSDDGFTHMNTKVLDNIEIYLPPFALQQAFVTKIELINQLKAKVSAEKSEELFQSLLQSTFKE